MKNKPVLIGAIFVVLMLLGIYTTKRIAENQYKRKMEEIKELKDSLDRQAQLLDEQYKKRDKVLKNDIQKYEARIKELEQQLDLSNQQLSKLSNKTQKTIKVTQQLMNKK